MRASKVLHWADELRALLRDGALPSLGIVDVGMGSRLTFEFAVRITLADLERLTHLMDGGHAVAMDRWQQVSEDIERLHRMAFAEPPL